MESISTVARPAESRSKRVVICDDTKELIALNELSNATFAPLHSPPKGISGATQSHTATKSHTVAINAGCVLSKRAT
jgi:hypothetical protein